jgi:F0F1-type ATP synthase epsilon subunit
VTLNFCLPHESIYKGAQVFSVILPGVEGEYGISVNHVPYVAQLKPGVVQIYHTETGSEVEKYFVPGGYALTHPNSVTVRTSDVCISVHFTFAVVDSLGYYLLDVDRMLFAPRLSNWTT